MQLIVNIRWLEYVTCGIANYTITIVTIMPYSQAIKDRTKMLAAERTAEPPTKQIAEQIANQIYIELLNRDSFAAQLHLYQRFDEAKYETLIKLFNAYIEQVKDSKDVNRVVVGCLYICEQELSGYLQQFESSSRRFSDAHAEVWGLVEKLWLTGWENWMPTASTE